MDKQYFSPERDGFCGAYCPNPVPGAKAMTAMPGDSSDDYMVKSGVKRLRRHGGSVIAISPTKESVFYDYFDRVRSFVYSVYPGGGCG